MITGISVIAGVLATTLLRQKKNAGSSSLASVYGLPDKITIEFDAELDLPKYTNRLSNCTIIADIWPFMHVTRVSRYLLNNLSRTDVLNGDDLYDALDELNDSLDLEVSIDTLGKFITGEYCYIYDIESSMSTDKSIVSYDDVRESYKRVNPNAGMFVRCSEYEYLWYDIVNKEGRISVTLSLNTNPELLTLNKESLISKVENTLFRGNVLAFDVLRPKILSNDKIQHVGSVKLSNPVLKGYDFDFPLVKLDSEIRTF